MFYKLLVRLTMLSWLLIVYPPQSFSASCHSFPDLSIMDRDFLLYLKNLTASHKNKVAILPFYDNAAGMPDATLHYGISYVIYDMYSSTNSHFINPYVSFAAAKELGLSDEKLSHVDSAKQIAKKLDARYVLFGAYQRTFHETLRVWINLYDTKNDQALSPVVEFETNYDDAIFNNLKHGVMQAFQNHKSAKAPNAPNYPNPSLLTFRYYSKGIELSSSYNTANLQLAAIWFEKALRESFQNYDDAALNFARAHFMMALIQRLSKQDSSQNLYAAKKALEFVRNKPNKIPNNQQLTYRFVRAASSGKNAVSAYLAKNTKEAYRWVVQALQDVPEDGFYQNLYLATSSGKKAKGITTSYPICF